VEGPLEAGEGAEGVCVEEGGMGAASAVPESESLAAVGADERALFSGSDGEATTRRERS
jgi:hypothetical protein